MPQLSPSSGLFIFCFLLLSFAILLMINNNFFIRPIKHFPKGADTPMNAKMMFMIY